MDSPDKKLFNYSEAHSTSETDLLRKINRETNVQVLYPRMLSGHLQGRFLSMVSHMVKPQRILEIGTFTGYSALCLAEGLAPGGKLFTIDINEELEERVRGYFHEANLAQVIDYRIGDARILVPELVETFQLIFIDADKENYALYYDLIIDKLASGGFILVDNVLWSGKVLDQKPDKDTRAVVEFNDKIQQDARVENMLLPVRDGVMMVRKK